MKEELSSFFSSGMTKHPNKNQNREEGCIWLTIPSCRPAFWGSQSRIHLVCHAILAVRGREKQLNPCHATCFLAHLVFYSLIQCRKPCPGNGTTHNADKELSVPELGNNQDYPTDKFPGQFELDIYLIEALIWKHSK